MVGHSVKFQRNGGEEPQLTVCDWLYTGQVEDNPHKVTPPDGTMGSAIFDEEGRCGAFGTAIFRPDSLRAWRML